jgi:hypothetical protein
MAFSSLRPTSFPEKNAVILDSNTPVLAVGATKPFDIATVCTWDVHTLFGGSGLVLLCCLTSSFVLKQGFFRFLLFEINGFYGPLLDIFSHLLTTHAFLHSTTLLQTLLHALRVLARPVHALTTSTLDSNTEL